MWIRIGLHFHSMVIMIANLSWQCQNEMSRRVSNSRQLMLKWFQFTWRPFSSIPGQGRRPPACIPSSLGTLWRRSAPATAFDPLIPAETGVGQTAWPNWRLRSQIVASTTSPESWHRLDTRLSSLFQSLWHRKWAFPVIGWIENALNCTHKNKKITSAQLQSVICI